ncbi:hypothetical protein THIX_60016 [Thiomonas sp. X19]|nr:hypothetical protein THIX_60016 [Thiomonas sp. X19]
MNTRHRKFWPKGLPHHLTIPNCADAAAAGGRPEPHHRGSLQRLHLQRSANHRPPVRRGVTREPRRAWVTLWVDMLAQKLPKSGTGKVQWRALQERESR